MGPGDVQSVLRCPQCQKPFDQASTLKRHGYYCRSRRDGTASRPRSCVFCAQGKARCDNGRPQCSRCISKGIECRYPSKAPGRALQKSQHDNRPIEAVELWLAGGPGNVEAPPVAGGNGEVGTVLGQGPLPAFEWDDGDVDFSLLLDQSSFYNAAQHPISTTPTQRGPVGPLNTPAATPEEIISFLGPSISLSPQLSRRSLIPRHRTETRDQRVASAVFQSLKSYPLMMAKHDTLPPFIHPSIVSLNTDNDDMEPLNNCISLVHMLGRGRQGSQKLFWGSVRRECERFRATYSQMNKWELLAVQQALFIYVIIRLDQGETEHNDFDHLVKTTVVAVGTRTKAIYRDHSTTPGRSRLEASWREWIFLESLRRLCVVYQVLNLLVCFGPAAHCDLQPDIIVAPLPTERRLWEASDAGEWKRENDKKSDAPVEFGLAANGELVRMGGDEPGAGEQRLDSCLERDAPSRPRASLAEWCSGMDSLGGLVMLAVPLVG